MLVRRLHEVDIEEVYTWRNDSLTRLMSLNSEIISWDSHKTWFTESLHSRTHHLFIGEVDGQGIGLCRFEEVAGKDLCEVSIFLNPLFRGKGLSAELLRLSILSLRHFCASTLCAKIRSDNQPSIKIFKSCGFELFDHSDNILIYRNG